jgi:Xaa-Pro aminopeptidase
VKDKIEEYKIPFVGRAVGHGIGLQWHENPLFKKGNKHVLKPGMVMTVEPKAYIDGIQYGHSDTILINEEGYEFLTDPTDISEGNILKV